MTRMIRHEDADLSDLAGLTVGVAGAVPQALPLALCLRDSGVRTGVIAGPHPEVESEGMPVLAPGQAQVIVVTGLHPHEQVQRLVTQGITSCRLVILTSAWETDLAAVTALLPKQTATALLLPQAPPGMVRRRFADGAGVSAVVAVSGAADGDHTWRLVLAVARALGLTRAGVLQATGDQVQAALSVCAGTVGVAGVAQLLRSTTSTLVGQGIDAEVAELLCLTSLRQASDVALALGVAGMAATASTGSTR